MVVINSNQFNNKNSRGIYLWYFLNWEKKIKMIFVLLTKNTLTVRQKVVKFSVSFRNIFEIISIEQNIFFVKINWKLLSNFEMNSLKSHENLFHGATQIGKVDIFHWCFDSFETIIFCYNLRLVHMVLRNNILRKNAHGATKKGLTFHYWCQLV